MDKYIPQKFYFCFRCGKKIFIYFDDVEITHSCNIKHEKDKKLK